MMINDKSRTNAYFEAIMSNKNLFKDKIVLDIGCGSGILSIFAAHAGAQHVYGVDNSSIHTLARKVVRDNGLENKITIIHGKIEEIELPVAKVDIIISEWMGYFLLYENMLESVLFARDKYLTEDGLMFPSHCRIKIAGFDDQQRYKMVVSQWDNLTYKVEGEKDDIKINMSALGNAVVNEVYCQYIEENQI